MGSFAGGGAVSKPSKEIAARLKEAREALGLDQAELAPRLQLSKQSLGRYERGDREAPSSVITSLAKLGISPLWVATGDGPMFLDGSEAEALLASGEVSDRKLLQRKLDEMGYVHPPYFAVSAAAGDGSVGEAETPDRALGFHRDWLHRELGANPADLILMNARGDSMQAKIRDGDLLLIDRSEPKLRSGNRIYVFVHDGLLFVKRLERRLDGGLIVSSENGDLYPPEQLSPEQARELNIIGRVIWNAGRA